MSTGEVQLLSALLPSIISLIVAVTAYLNRRTIKHIKAKQDNVVAPDAAMAKGVSHVLQQRVDELKAKQDVLDQKINGGL